MAPFSKATPREPRLLRMFCVNRNDFYTGHIKPHVKFFCACFAPARLNNH